MKYTGQALLLLICERVFAAGSDAHPRCQNSRLRHARIA